MNDSNVTIEKEDDKIEIELKFKDKETKIHGSGKGVWAVCATVLGVSAITSAVMVSACGSSAYLLSKLIKNRI